MSVMFFLFACSSSFLFLQLCVRMNNLETVQTLLMEMAEYTDEQLSLVTGFSSHTTYVYII